MPLPTLELWAVQEKVSMGRKRGTKKTTMPVRHPHPKRSISSLGETEFMEVKRKEREKRQSLQQYKQSMLEYTFAQHRVDAAKDLQVHTLSYRHYTTSAWCLYRRRRECLSRTKSRRFFSTTILACPSRDSSAVQRGSTKSVLNLLGGRQSSQRPQVVLLEI